MLLTDNHDPYAVWVKKTRVRFSYPTISVFCDPCGAVDSTADHFSAIGNTRDTVVDSIITKVRELARPVMYREDASDEYQDLDIATLEAVLQHTLVMRRNEEGVDKMSWNAKVRVLYGSGQFCLAHNDSLKSTTKYEHFKVAREAIARIAELGRPIMYRYDPKSSVQGVFEDTDMFRVTMDMLNDERIYHKMETNYEPSQSADHQGV